MRLPFIAWSIAGVPSALPGYLTTAHHLCAFLMYSGTLAVWRQNMKIQKSSRGREHPHKKKQAELVTVVVSCSGWSDPKPSVCPCPADIYVYFALFYLSVLHSVLLHTKKNYFHNMTGLHKYTHINTHTQTHIRRRTPKDTPKGTLHTHKHTHIHARQCVANRYALTHTNMHIHTYTHTHLQYASFCDWVAEGCKYFFRHRYQTCFHPHYLRASTASFVAPHPAFSPPSHLYRWSAKMTAVMDGSELQDFHNVYLPGWQRYTWTFQDHAETMSCNLNRGGDGRRGTRTELKHVEDWQARAWVPRGWRGRHTTCTRVTRGGGRDNTFLCQWDGKETSANTSFLILPTLLLSRCCSDKACHVSPRSLKTQPRRPW